MAEEVRYQDIANTVGYRVGTDGSVWSQRATGQWNPVSIYRRPYGCRYCVVCLRPAPRTKVRCLYVHRLVLEAFVGPCPDSMEVCHNDGDTSNNHLSNLRYGTRADNIADQVRHGTVARGERNINAELTEDDIREIRLLASRGIRRRTIAAQFGIGPNHVSAIANGRSWHHLVSTEKPLRRPHCGEESDSKLTEEQVRTIRRLVQEGGTRVAVAALFGVTPSNITMIVQRKTWRHVV